MSSISSKAVQGGLGESVDRFCDIQLQLVDVEREAEEGQTAEEMQSLSLKQLEEKGVALSSLTVSEKKEGLGGRTLLTLTREKWLGGAKGKGDEPLLPAHKFSSGDIVCLRPASASAAPTAKSADDHRGLVYRVTETRVVVAVENEDSEEVEGQVRLFKLANDVTYKRYRKAMHSLREYSSGPATHLKDVLFGAALPHFRPIPPPEERKWYPVNKDLNGPQLAAIDFAMAATDLALIHGPPGTGKTTTVVEFITQAVKAGSRVLAAAPSNIAVDNMAERLAAQRVKIVRIGHPARVLDNVVASTLDMQVHLSEGRALAEDARADVGKLLSKIGKEKNKSEKARIRSELSALRKEIRRREDAAVKEVIGHAEVVLCTNSGAADRVLDAVEGFDVVVIDEAAMALEVSCWIPILRGKKLILAGDHCQLAPTIMSKEAEKNGLGRTLFDRCLELYGEECVRMLSIQYRMHQDISDWCSDAMYGGKLAAGESVRERKLHELPHVAETEETEAAMVVVDTAGCDMGEEKDDAGSTRNEGEAMVVSCHVAALMAAGLRQDDIGVLTPYNAQATLLRGLLKERYPSLEIGSVDGFQGREKEVIVLSLVRSNPRREVGFLADDRRLNVGITRAKRQVVVVCDSETVSSHRFIQGLISFCEARGADWRSAQEYLDAEGSFSFSRGDAGPKTAGAGKGKKKAAKAKEEREAETEEQAAQRAAIQRRLEEFIASEETSLQFPTTLSGFERLAVHEECEARGLMHESVGEKQDRFVTARKKPKAMLSRPPPSAADPARSAAADPPPGASAPAAPPLAPEAAALRAAKRAPSSSSADAPAAAHTHPASSSSDDDDTAQPPPQPRPEGDDSDSAPHAPAAPAAPPPSQEQQTPPAEAAARPDVAPPASETAGNGAGAAGDNKGGVGGNKGGGGGAGKSLTQQLHEERLARERERQQAEKAADVKFVVAFQKKVIELEFGPEEEVLAVKAVLEKKTGVRRDAQKLMYKKMLADKDKVGYCIKAGCKIMLIGNPTLKVEEEEEEKASEKKEAAAAADESEAAAEGGGAASLTAQLRAEREARAAALAARGNAFAALGAGEEEEEEEGNEAGPAARGGGGKKGKGKKGGGGGAGPKKGGGGGGGGGGGKIKEGAGGGDEEDLDELLKSLDMKRGIDSCGVKGCKFDNVQLLGTVCQFCRLHYCLQHALPEAHGCGEAAKAGAKEKWEREMRKAKEDDRARGAGRPLLPGHQKQREEVLRKELQKKIADKEGSRARKTKDDDKNKRR